MKGICATTYATHRHNVEIDHPKLSKEEAERNAFGMTAIDLLHSSSANDVRNRNEFQKDITLTTVFNGQNIAEHRANKKKTKKKRKKSDDIYASNANEPLVLHEVDSDSPIPTDTLNFDMARTGARFARNRLESLPVPTPMTGEASSVSIQDNAGFMLLEEMEEEELFLDETISTMSMRNISAGIDRIRQGIPETIDKIVLRCANVFAKKGKSSKDLLPKVNDFYESVSKL